MPCAGPKGSRRHPDEPPCNPTTSVASLLIRLFGVALLLTALALSLSRAPDRPVETLVARWAPAPSDFLDLDGQLVHVRDEGPRDDPAPLVMLHGVMSSLHTWEGWAQGLKTGRRVIRVDLPGHGLTGPSPSGDYRADADVRFVLALLDKLDVPRATLVGHSLGGGIAWRLAANAPQRVDRLVLVAPVLPDPAGLPLVLELLTLPVIDSIAEQALPRPFVAAGLRQAWGDPGRVDDTLVERHFELLLRAGNRRALIERLRQFEPEAGAGLLARIGQPTLLLWGSRDRLIPPSAGQALQRRIAGSTLVVLDGLGHVPQEEDAAASLAPVKAFLAAPR